MAERYGGIAVLPGSYDPVTMGHIDIIGRAAGVFDNVIVGVVNQPVRKSKTLFSAEERVAFIEEGTADLGNVQVKPFDTLLVDFAREHGAKAIVKGLRAISDFEYEFEMNQLNQKDGARHREHLPDGRAAVQLPVIQRDQGIGDIRWRHRRARARLGGRAVAGRAKALKNWGT